VPESYLRQVNLSRQMLREHTPKAARVLIKAMDDPDSKVAVAAAKEVLSRAGVPVMQAIQASIETDNIPMTVIKWPDGKELPKPARKSN
jgi:hypothetical protein